MKEMIAVWNYKEQYNLTIKKAQYQYEVFGPDVNFIGFD